MKKIRVGILFGGKSAEHEVSLRSAQNVVAALDPNKYEPVLIGIEKSGRWLLPSKTLVISSDPPALCSCAEGSREISDEIPRQARDDSHFGLSLVPGGEVPAELDVVFPALHGTNGEDGTVQGLLKLMDVPFVGPSVLGSAVGMDKDVAKRLMRDAGITIAKFVTLYVHRKSEIAFDDLVARLGLPFFVKPANAGSSVGVSKVKSKDDFQQALDDAFAYDTKILVEEFIKGREIEVSVLGNEDPIASVPGEIIPTHEFYSYEAKYLDENGSKMEIPAKLSAELARAIQETAIKTFRALNCEGMSRVDFFVRGDEVFVNEINTIPGFTNVSMYPKMWEASGISYPELIDRLISLAISRHERDKKLKTSFSA